MFFLARAALQSLFRDKAFWGRPASDISTGLYIGIGLRGGTIIAPFWKYIETYQSLRRWCNNRTTSVVVGIYHSTKKAPIVYGTIQYGTIPYHWVTTLIVPGVQMLKYPVPGVYFRTDLGHFFKNDYHNIFWLQMSQISFFAWFPNIDSKIHETTVVLITIPPHILHHPFVRTPWRSSNDPRAEYCRSCLSLPLAIVLRCSRSS